MSDNLTDWALVGQADGADVIDLIDRAWGGTLAREKLVECLNKAVSESTLTLETIGLALGHYGPSAFAVDYKLGDCLILHSIMDQYNIMPWQAGECIRMVILKLWEAPLGVNWQILGTRGLLEWVSFYRAEYRDIQSEHSKWAYIQTRASHDTAGGVAVLLKASEFEQRKNWFDMVGI